MSSSPTPGGPAGPDRLLRPSPGSAFLPVLIAGTLLAVVPACSPAMAGLRSPCAPEAAARPLPPEVPESSGVAPSSRHPGVFWTHNDSGWDAVLFAVDGEGRLLGEVEVQGARNRDWEDLAVGPCEEIHCLYIADTGDNRRVRETAAVYRVPEPEPGQDAPARAERFPVWFPHGPRDVEAAYLLPGERLFLVTKGRGGPVEVYRVPAPLDRPGRVLELERIQRLTDRRPPPSRWVTGGAATADGRLVALRTYETLQLYRPDETGRLEPVSGGLVNLRPLREPQGEAVAFVPGGRFVLTSEAGPGRSRGGLARIRCEGMEEAW